MLRSKTAPSAFNSAEAIGAGFMFCCTILLLVGMTAEAVQVKEELLAKVAFDPVGNDGGAPDVPTGVTLKPEEEAPLGTVLA